ncbi:protein kinase domain-containing protein [Actinomadura kijaniata]|uniref:protein kinase domain-containing protein n=1 Tax=Actinomadura kijaniata TaxID=46161 RepID=UPI000830B734|nr:PASTA domain-containing protein [Actinomadura kijaniata]
MTTPSPLRPEDPERLGAYRMLGRLGQGGQGVVLLGEDADGGRVAVKLLHTQPEQDSVGRRRFVQELAAAKRVARFCTAQVLDADMAGDRPYIVSEYVEGTPLNRAVADNGPLSDGALERLAIGTATALVAIHRAGLVHRDFKPHNVLLGGDGPRVIDFGIAKALDAAATVTSGVVGTPAYMAPEQMGGGTPVGPAADVFAWGATLCFAASGAPPFGQDSIPAVIGRILNAEPDLGALEGPLRDLVARALAKDPAERPTAMGLLHHLLGQDAPAAAEPDTERAAAPSRPEEGLLEQGSAHAAPASPAAPVSSPATVAAPQTTAPRVPASRPDDAPPTDRTQAPLPRRSGGRARKGLAAAVLIGLLGGGGYLGYLNLRDGTGTGTGATPGAAERTKVRVPELIGTPEGDAVAILKSEGLGHSVRRRTSDRPAGQVIAMTPTSGSEVPEGTPVLLVISTGPAAVPPPRSPSGSVSPSGAPSSDGQVTVPSLVGLTETEARRLALRAGLVLPDTASEGGRVDTQRPAAGERARRGTPITVTWRV